MDHPRAEPVVERLDGGIERREHDAVALVHGEARQAVLTRVEVVRHTAASVDPAPERQAHQRAIEPVRPVVVRASKTQGVAERFVTQPHTAMRAPVLQHVDRSIAIAGDDHRSFADRGGLVVAGLRHLRAQSDEAPLRPVEEPVELAAVERVVVVDPQRHTREVAGGPRLALGRGADEIGHVDRSTASRLVTNPGSAPSSLTGSSRSSCHTSEPIARCNGLSWTASWYTSCSFDAWWCTSQAGAMKIRSPGPHSMRVPPTVLQPVPSMK